MGAVMFGNGVAGVSTNLLRALLELLLAGEDNFFTVALIFFALAVVFLFVCAAAYWKLEKNEFFLYY